jgi:hypothetical protein
LVAPTEKGLNENLKLFKKIRFERIKELVQLYYNDLCTLLDLEKPKLSYHQKVLYGIEPINSLL